MSGGVFAMIPAWVLDDGLLSPPELAVYAILGRHADRYGRSWPSIKTIARKSQQSESTVKRTIRRLVERRIVEVEPRFSSELGQISNSYRVRFYDRERPAVEHPQVSQTRGPGLSGAGAQVSATYEAEPEEAEPEEADTTSRLQAVSTTVSDSRETVDSLTRAQSDYLRELWIHSHGRTPSAEVMQGISALTFAAAEERIGAELRAMPRGDDYLGPESGMQAYDELSATGKEWADKRMTPSGYNYPTAEPVALTTRRRSA